MSGRANRYNGRCEETVVVMGNPQACHRPLDENGYCDRPGDHVDDYED